MDTLLLIFLIAIDVLLFGYVYFSSRGRSPSGSMMTEIREERRILEELRTSLRDELSTAEQRIIASRDKILALAAETEVEHESLKQILKDNSENLASQIEAKLHEPIEKINERCERAHKYLDRINLEKESLQKALRRAEVISKFFNKDLPYSELIEEIEDKKYIDARQMLSKGIAPEVVSKELNMPVSEVKFLRNQFT